MSKETISQTEGLCKEVATCIRNAYDRGYKQGFKDGNYDKEFFCNLNFEHGTNKGLDDAWECCRKMEEILFNATNEEFQKIFDAPDFHSALTHFDAKKCMQKIKEYEEKQKQDEDEIEVGDEILIHNIQDAETYKAVVMDIDTDKGLWIFDENACNTVIEPNRYIGEEADIEVRKTGRTYPQIAEVLEQLKGEE